ncbi:MAG: hypothetical protein ACR2JG_12405 [Geodermatophilaceae bacterium]
MSPVAGEPVAGPAAEARRLVEALGDWASTRLGTTEHLATGAPECDVCPVCQLVAALRGQRPDVLARLGDAWAAFLGVLTDHPHPSDPSPAPSSAAPPAPTPEPESEPQLEDPPIRPVQNIDVR